MLGSRDERTLHHTESIRAIKIVHKKGQLPGTTVLRF